MLRYIQVPKHTTAAMVKASEVPKPTNSRNGWLAGLLSAPAAKLRPCNIRCAMLTRILPRNPGRAKTLKRAWTLKLADNFACRKPSFNNCRAFTSEFSQENRAGQVAQVSQARAQFSVYTRPENQFSTTAGGGPVWPPRDGNIGNPNFREA